MFNILEKVIFGPYQRKVQKYLHNVTTDSVLKELKNALAPKTREISNLSTIFDAYAVEDSSEERFWNKESLREHIESTHPAIATSQAAIQLLWRCFHFYAYHPFPRDLTHDKVEFAAFERVISLLVGQGTDLLGTQDEGAYFWGHDEAFFRKSDFERIFRSLSMPYRSDEEATRSDRDHDSTAAASDVIDVLAMLQPSIISIAPSPEQLEPVARKLLGDGVDQLYYQLARDDLSLLLSLLMQLRLRKKKWGARLHFGSFEKADGSSEELAAKIVKRLGGSKDKVYLTTEEVQNAMSSLPTLQSRFYQLWAVLFQPSEKFEDKGENFSSEEWEPNFQFDQTDDSPVSGNGNPETTREEASVKPVNPSYTLESTEPKFRGEELAKRIQGFGSGK